MKGTAAPYERQRGYLLITVVVMLFLLATIAMLLNYGSAISANTSSGELETARVDYVAEAAMQHALWRAQNNACMGNVTIPPTTLGPDSYSATVTGAAAGIAYTLTVDQDAWIRSDDVTKINGGTADQHIRSETGNIERALFRFDVTSIPANSAINSAVAWFYVKSTGAHPEGPVTVQRVTVDWTETGATWETMNDKFENSILAMVPAQPTGGVWIQVNLTAQVQAWANGQPNFGIVLGTTAEGVHTMYMSREDGANPPRLEVVVGSGPASPVTIKATGELDNGVKKKLKDKLTVAYQPPGTVILQLGTDPGGDALVDSFYERNYGGSDYLQVNGDPAWIQRLLLKFELGRIPAHAKVLSARLELSVVSVATAGTATVHRVARSWVEGTRNGGGTADGATWSTFDGSTNWTSTGGDFNASVVATATIDPADTWVAWEIGPLVEQWLAGEPNDGLLIQGDAALRRAKFASREDSNTAVQPKLTITYGCECGSACMAPNGSGNILMVASGNPLSPADTIKKALIESWGYTVDTLAQQSGQTSFDNTFAANDAVYVPASVDPAVLDTKLTNAPIGVVSENGGLNGALGIASGSASPVGSTININDNSHYITMLFASGPLIIYSAAMEGIAVAGAPAPGLQTLGDWNGAGGPVVLDAGAATSGGGAAPGRRVLLPVGGAGIDFAHVNNNGRLIFQRSLAWAMGADIGIGEPVLLSTDSAATLGGLTFDDIDLVEYDPGNDSANLFFEGDLTTLISDIDALHILANDHIVMSTKVDSIFGGLKFTDGSLIDYDPATDVATLYFDESAFSDDENIVSVYVMDNGHILLSTDTDATLGGLSFTDNDLVEYDPRTDTATLYFDGSATTLISDIDALHVLENGHIVLSSKDNASLGGLSFDDGDLVDYDPVADTAVLYFDEGLFAADEDLISTHIGPGSGKAIPRKKVYWTDDNAELIQRSNEDGSNIETLVSGQTMARGLDLDTVNGKMYWTSDGDIRRADLDGSNIETIFSGSLVNLDIKLDVAAGKMYWSHDNNNVQVMRADLDGSNSETINSSLGIPAYMTLDTAAGYLYITEFAVGNVSRMNLDGSSSTTLITGPDGAVGNALDPVGGKIYWSGGASNDWIKRADLDGSNEETIVTGLNAPQDIVYDADNNRIYWTDALVIPAIKRANADGSDVQTIVTAGLNRPRGITLVNADLVPPTGGGGGGGGGSGACDGTFRDEFNTVSYSNNDGSLSWTDDWLEINETDGANSGDEQVVSDTGHSSLRLRDNDGGGEGVEREANLSGATTASLSLFYRRLNLDTIDDKVTIWISSNGSAGPWSELIFFAGGGTDNDYISFSIDISTFISANTRIRFLTSPTMGRNDEIYFDDIQIQCVP